MEETPKEKPENLDPPALEFTVMPTEDSAPATDGELTGSLHPRRFFLGRALGLIIFAAAIALGAIGWFVYAQYFQKAEEEAAAPLDIKAPDAEAVDTDSDDDGLLDSEEFDLSTNPQKSDSDDDGLADGDEVKIYKSDPLLPDTDGDTFTDGREVAGGYSPIANSVGKAGTGELAAWTRGISEHGIHEPSRTTLNIVSAPAAEQGTLYQNAAYLYQIQLSSVLTYREDGEKRLVGFYVLGTTPDDEIGTEPIHASIAVRIAGEKLRAWAENFYGGQTYAAIEDLEFTGGEGVRVRSVGGDSCPQDVALFSADTRVIVLTWTCNQAAEFGPLYESMVASFSFSP